MIRVGIVGCGKMADQHAIQIQRIANAEIVGVCDSEVLMAEQLGERFNVRRCFSDVREMLSTLELDVVHITTPPQSHFELGKLCLEFGCHVYIEKPFTLNTREAEDLIGLANEKRLKLTAGHNAQFTHAMVRLRDLIRGGYLGGKPVHLESIYCYNLRNTSYAQAFLGDDGHWLRRLPGSLLQNVMSHGISKIAEFLTGDQPVVIAHGFTSSFLRSIGQHDVIDEVRVIIRDEDRTTAYFTFSSQISPAIQQFRVYGPRHSLVVDEDHQIVIKVGNSDRKSYARYFVSPLDYAKQYVESMARNAIRFMANDFHQPSDAGLKTLIESFYEASGSKDLPISHREILLTSRIMDETFAQLKRECR